MDKGEFTAPRIRVADPLGRFQREPIETSGSEGIYFESGSASQEVYLPARGDVTSETPWNRV